jgi:hypothetical protein
MRALVISDLHFGAWTGDPLLRHEFALKRLAPHLEDVDELILLGDVFDFMFSTVENAFAQAEPFFDLVSEKMQGGRVVFLAGNHDHHIVVHALRSAVEVKLATGAGGPDLERIFETEYRNFFQRFLDRRLPGIETEMAYPTYKFGRTILFHGHYLDAHMEGSLPNRLLTRAVWSIAGGRPEAVTMEDYEAVIVPLTELLFTVAQLPRGTAAQQSFYEQFERLSRWLWLTDAVQRALSTLKTEISSRARSLRGDRHEATADAGSQFGFALPGSSELDRQRSVSISLERASELLEQGRTRRREGTTRDLTGALSASAPAPLALGAYGQVVRNLGWDMESATMVFGHTHQPLDGTFDPACGPVRFWNTGSWVYEPTLASSEAYMNYLERAWPGTGIVIDTEKPEPKLVEMLADQNPLSGGALPTDLHRPSQDRSQRLARYNEKLRRFARPRS